MLKSKKKKKKKKNQGNRGKLSILFEPPTISKILNIHLSHQTIRGLHSPSHPHMHSKDWKDLWKLIVNTKLKNLLWKMCWNILSTCSVLNIRFPIFSLNCFFCNSAPETIEHLFLQCDWVV